MYKGIDKQTSLPSSKPVLPRAVIATLCFLWCTTSVSADDRPWNRYENDYFVAYSNAEPGDAGKILEALELFRAAAFQIPSFVIPEGRPKTRVILPATREEFLTFTSYESVAAFSTMLAGQPTIVLPANEPDLDVQAVVGHEFAHTLLFNDAFTYPSWYAEGFSGIASSVVIDRKRETLTISTRRDLEKKSKSPALDWNSLLDESFNAHALGDINLTASAYAQDWLLVHFLTLNESRDFASELNQYFANVNNGMPGRAAFTAAFGKSAAEFGKDDLPAYLGEISEREFSFDPTTLDLDFQIRVGVNGEIRPVLTFMKDNADIRHGRNAPATPADYLQGRWDWLRLADQCSEPISFRLREDGVLVLEAYYSDDETDPVPALFSIDTSDDGALELSNITADEYPQIRVVSDYRAVMRSPDVMCFDAQPASRDCLRALHRCDR